MVQSLASLGAGLSVFLLLVLVARRSARPADRWLAVWLLSQAGFCVGVLVGLAASPQVAFGVLLAGQFAIIVAGSAHYLYAVSALGVPRHLGRLAATAVAVSVPLLVLLFAAPLRIEAGALVTDLTTPWVALLPPVGLILVSGYPVAVLRLVARHQEQLKTQVSQLDSSVPDWLRGWAGSILAFNLSLTLVFANSVFASWPVHVHMSVSLVILVTHLAYVGQRGLHNPGVFVAPTPFVPPSRSKPEIDRLRATEDYSRLQALLVHDKPHLLPNLTAEMLADRLGWAPDRLTESLRHGGAVNFFDAINAERVREVQSLARAPENAHISLLVLAYQSGFGSKTAFYDAFRRHAGCTPAAWRRLEVTP